MSLLENSSSAFMMPLVVVVVVFVVLLVVVTSVLPPAKVANIAATSKLRMMKNLFVFMGCPSVCLEGNPDSPDLQ